MGWFDWLTGGEVQERQSAPAFKEQAFLMYNIKKIAPIHNQNYDSYQKLTLLKGGASQVVNRILNADYFIKRPMMDLTPAEISELVPRLRLYKQEFKNDGTFEKEIEIKFPVYTEPDAALDPTRAGYGLKSISLNTRGGNAFQSQINFDCTLVLYFQSMDLLIENRDGFSFLDLIVIPPQSMVNPDINQKDLKARRKINNYSVSADSFRIRVELGWSLGQITSSSAFNNYNAEQRNALIDAIKASKLIFTLSHIDNEVSITEQGTVTVTINYRAASDIIYRDIRAGIVMPGEDRDALDKLSDEIDKLLQQKQNTPEGTEPDPSLEKQIQDKKNELASKQSSLTTKVFSSITEELFSKNKSGKSKVYETVLSRAIANDFAAKLTANSVNFNTGSAPPAPSPTSTAVEDIKWNLVKKTNNNVEFNFFEPILSSGETYTVDQLMNDPLPKTEDGTMFEPIQFVFFGDLLELFMNRAFEDQKSNNPNYRRFGADFSRRVKMILTDFEFLDFQTGNPYRINLAHVPVSLARLKDFIIEKIITPIDLNYTIQDFVVDFLTSLSKDVFLGRNYDFNKVLRQNIRFEVNQLALNLNGDAQDPLLKNFGDGSKPCVARADKINKKDYGNFLQSSKLGNVNASDYFYYIMINAVPALAFDRTGDFKRDEEAGIPHIYIGRDRGIVKKVNFVKNPTPRAKEIRVEKEKRGFDPVFALISRYNVEMEMVGNTVMPLNSDFFLLPTGLGSKFGLPTQRDSVANLMGIGGYYKILKISWNVDENMKFTSKISAVNNGTGAQDDPNSEIVDLSDYLNKGRIFIPLTD